MIYVDKYAYISKLNKKNPAIKTIFALVSLLMALCINSVYLWCLLLFIMMFLCVYYGKIPLKYYLKLLLMPSLFLLLSVLGIIVNIAAAEVPEPALKIGAFYFYITRTGVLKAINLYLRALSAISCMYFLVLNTPMSEIIMLFKSIGLPALFLDLMAFTYRFIFILMDIASTKNKSIQSRFGYSNLKNSFRSFGMLAGSVFIQSNLRGKNISRAMAARGYEGTYKVLNDPSKPSMKSYLLLLIYFIAIGTLGLWTMG